MKDDIAVRKAAMLKTARSLVRLKHSIAADAELNSVIPRLEASFDASVNAGVLPETSVLLLDAGVFNED